MGGLLRRAAASLSEVECVEFADSACSLLAAEALAAEAAGEGCAAARLARALLAHVRLRRRARSASHP